jgi:starvation-inducible DNA-binding protein
MFEEHYTEFAIEVDDITKRIRTLNSMTPGTYKQFAKLSSIEEVDRVPIASDMIAKLTQSRECFIRTAREVLKIT